MKDTTLRFLMVDGAMSATFSPPLSPAQYEELYALVQAPSTKARLRVVLEAAAERWGIKLAVDLEAI